MQHTSASLTINENYDPDVQADTETFLNRIVPEVSVFFLLASLVLALCWCQLITFFGWNSGEFSALEAYHGRLVVGFIKANLWSNDKIKAVPFILWNVILFCISSESCVLRIELCKIIAGPDDMPAHIKSSMFGCQLTWATIFIITLVCVSTVYC